MTSDIVTDALTTAWFRRRPATGVLNHFQIRGAKANSTDHRHTFNQGGIYGRRAGWIQIFVLVRFELTGEMA
jgi:hypothetical protein